MFKVPELLQSKGHIVVPFSVEHPRDRATDFEQFCVADLPKQGRNTFGPDGLAHTAAASGKDGLFIRRQAKNENPP